MLVMTSKRRGPCLRCYRLYFGAHRGACSRSRNLRQARDCDCGRQRFRRHRRRLRRQHAPQQFQRLRSLPGAWRPFPFLSYWTAAAPAGAFGFRQLLIVALVAVWGCRLTTNWALRWRGPADEDFRYVEIRGKTGRATGRRVSSRFTSCRRFGFSWVFCRFFQHSRGRDSESWTWLPRW